jgi:putative hemolysin
VSTNAVLTLLHIDQKTEADQVTETEIRDMVDIGRQKGSIDDDEQMFINNIFDFSDKKIKEVMTHRTDVSFLWFDESIEKWEEAINNSPYSVYPVCKKNIDDIIGILDVKDYFRAKEKTHEAILKNCLKSAYFIPDIVRTDVLFHNMQNNKNHFAIVIDEHGGTSGIVTMNDLLEELVGDLENDASIPDDPPEIERIDANTWKINGVASIDDVSSALNIALPNDKYDTFGGLVFSMIGIIPDDGSTFESAIYGMNIKITEIKDRRLVSALVSLAEKNV